MPNTDTLIFLSAFLLAGISGWLILLLIFPKKWEKLARMEYDFHCQKKWIPEKFARWQLDFSLGKGLKLTLISMWLSILGCLASLWCNQG